MRACVRDVKRHHYLMKTNFQIGLASLLAVTALWTGCSTKSAPAVVTTAPNYTITNTAVIPVPRDTNWVKRHEGFVARAKQGGVDILFRGDSITDGCRGKKLWKEKYEPMKAVDFGIGGDKTEHVLWRMKNGELEGIKPKVI